MLNKIKNSLVVQTGFLFIVSLIVIVVLWVVFYFQQKYQHMQYDMARYFNVASTLQPYLNSNVKITNETLKIFDMNLYEKTLPKNHKVTLQKGDKNKGFAIVEQNKRVFIHIHNKQNEVIVEDIQEHKSMLIIHTVFALLLFTQLFLFFKIRRSLVPLSKLHRKLEKLEDGDLSPLQIDTNYDELKQIISSYNSSISKIENIIELREMFNKIFMHEMKMPIAKGMFYLKHEPSSFTHEKLSNILHGLNKELDEFSQIETLIVSQNKIEAKKQNLFSLVYEAINKVGAEHLEKIELEIDKTLEIQADKELLILCFKNLIDNAMKYSKDTKLKISADKDSISFINKADELPVDISKEIKRWKIDRSKRHKSSTGYGFGLFIIKSIITLHKYKLEYNYKKEDEKIELKIRF